MPEVRRLRQRGANVVVLAAGEPLFAPNGDVTKWVRTFGRDVRKFSIQEAPRNKRPRWKHYGAPLKRTIIQTTQPSPITMLVHSAVGSRAPHAYYVDQGTGVYAGKGAYQGKILPPWNWGSPSLYEHTWVPPGSFSKNDDLGTVTIRGQKGQKFFDKGLNRAFIKAGMPYIEVPSLGGLAQRAVNTMPVGMTNFAGNTPWSFAFDAQLREWRAWRDDAWNRVYKLGDNGGRRRRSRKSRARGYSRRVTEEERKAKSAARSRKYRERQREKNPTSKAKAKNSVALRAERARFLSTMQKRYGIENVDVASLEFRTVKGQGYWYITIRKKDDRGRTIFDEVRGKSTV